MSSDSDDEYQSSENELVEPLLRENKRLRWTLAKYQKKNSILKDVLADKDIKISELQKRDEERDELLSKQEDTIRNLIRQMNEQTAELNFMAAKLKDASEEGGNDVKPAREGISPRDTEVTSLKATIDIQSRRNNELSDELQQERKKREKLETDIDMWKFNLGECESEIEQLKEQREKLKQDFQRMKRDADVSKRLLNDVKLQLKNVKSEQEQAQNKADEQKKETVEIKSLVDKERRNANKFKEDHDKMKEKFDEYRRGYEDIKVKHDQVKRELAETKEELRVKLHQYSRQNRHFKDLERKYRELTEMHNRLKDRMDEKENELQEKDKLLKEFQEKVWVKDKVMNDFKVNAEEALERAAELDKSLEEKDEDVQSLKKKIASLAQLVNELKSELARNNVDDLRRELEKKDGVVRELKGELNQAKNKLERKEEELEYLKKASEDLQFIASTLEEKEYEVTKLEAMNSDLKTQMNFKDDQLTNLQKVMEEQKILLESQMFDLEAYERQVNDKDKLVQDLKDQIDQHCRSIDQKDKEIKRHKREKDDVRKEVEWKEKKVQGVEEDISLQRKQLQLMEKEMKRRENEVEERENSILMELATMKEAMAEKDAKIENLNSDLMEVKEYIEEEAKLVAEKDKEMEELKDELKREKEANKTNDPKSIREMARKQHQADLMKEKRRHEQECKKLKQRMLELEENLKDGKEQAEETRKEKEARLKKFEEEKGKLEGVIKELTGKLESQKKARLSDKKLSENIEKKFWTEEEKYVEQIRAIELSREKLKYENESLREDVEALEGVREKLEERTREVEDLKIELDEVMQAKKEEKEMMKKLISEGEEVIAMYQSEIQQLKGELIREPAINTNRPVSGSVEEMRRLIELEYNIGKEARNFEDDGGIEQDYMRIMQEQNRKPRDGVFGKNIGQKSTKQENIWSYSWLSLLLILISVPVLFSQFPTHVVITCVLLYLSTLGYLTWKETGGCKQTSKQGEANDALSKAVGDIYEENQSLRKTVEQLIVRVASETVEKNNLAKRPGPRGERSGSSGTAAREPGAKNLGQELAEKKKMVETLSEIRKTLTEEGKQLKAKLRANEGVLQQKDKVIKKLEHKLRDLMDGEGVDLSTEKILQEIRQDDEQKDAKKRAALERFQELTTTVMKNSKDEKKLGGVFFTIIAVGLVFLGVCQRSFFLGSTVLAVLCVVMALMFWFIVKSRDEVAKLAEELNMEAERSLESSKEIQELSTLVEKHLEVVTKQKQAISALERQLKVEHARNENQKVIIAKLTWTIQEGKDIENLLGRSGSYRGQDKKALEQALKTMAESHVKEKIELFKTMRTHLADDDVDNEEKRWILQDLKQATRDITKSLPSVPQKLDGCKVKELKRFWKVGVAFLICFLAFLWLFYAEYFGLSLLPLIGCAAFIVLKKSEAKCGKSCDTKIRRFVLDILFVCIVISTISLVHSNGYLQKMAFIIVLAMAGGRALFKKLVPSDESVLSQQKSQEIEELRERVGEEVRRQERMVEQMETWKQLLEVERSYNKESDDVLTEVREMEQRTQREVRREIERLRKEKRERLKNIEELEKELKKSTTHCSKQRRQMEELNKIIKELEKKQKQGSREIDVLKELNKYEKEELSVALEEEKKSREKIIKNVEKEKEKVKNEMNSKLNLEKKDLSEKVKKLEQKLDEERKVAKDFLDQVDSELAKNEKMNGEIAEMRSQMEHEKETREDLRKRFQEINKIRQDREKVLLDQIDDLQNQLAKQKKTLETVTQELEDNSDGSKKEKSQSLYNVQEKQISEMQNRLSRATKTIEELRQQEKNTAKDMQDLRDRQGKLLKDLGALQDKSSQDHRTIQRKQKDIKELKASLERLTRENERLNKKLEAAWLESSLGATVVKAEVVNEDKEGDGDDRIGLDESRGGQNERKDKQPESDTTTVNDGLDTSRSEDITVAELAEVSENEDYLKSDEESTKRGVPADFDNKDTQGILYWLGTSGGTEEWKNPGEAGLVKIARSSYGHGKASDVADRKGSWCSTSNKANQWWKIDFGEKRSILPSAYTLQHGWSGVSGALRNWVLEGSRDGKVWHILSNHVNDETLDKGYAAATWKIDDVTTPYRYLRVRQTGKNEAGKDSLRLSGFEVYGQLVLND